MTVKNIYGDGWIYPTKQDTFGGIDITISIAPQLKELVDWMLAHRAEHDKELELRNSDPSVKLAYDAYKMAIALCSEGA